MAAIRPRRRTNGTISYTVRWRLGGTRDGAWQSETFHARQAARDFKLDVEDAGHRWPAGWIKGAGYVRVVDEPDAPPEPHRLLDFGLEFVKTRTGIGPDTRTLYAAHIGRMDTWLTPIVGGLPMVETLTNDHVRLLVNYRERVGAAPKTIRNYHGLLFSVMEYAIERKLREGNPCRGTRLPEPADIDDDDQMTFLTEAEYRLIHGCFGDDLVAADMSEVAVGTGLRFGEITALQKRDLIVDANGRVRISVRRAWKNNGRGEYALAEHGPRYLGKPKSKKSRRRVSTAPVVGAILLRNAEGKAETDFIFTSANGGPIEEHFTDRRWAKAVKLAQTKGLTKTPRFHDLRHTNAAWLISANVPLPVIQRRLGHDSITTTVHIYGGLLDQAQEAADVAIEAALVGGRVPTPTPTPNRLLVVAADANYEAEPGVDEEVTYDPDDAALPEIDTAVA